MIGDHWFEFRGRWHILSGDRESVCGIGLLDPPRTVQPTSEDPRPPNACAKCLVILFEETMVEEEPLEDAFDRGFAPAPTD